jgi:hypothetical protein
MDAEGALSEICPECGGARSVYADHQCTCDICERCDAVIDQDTGVCTLGCEGMLP